MPLQDIYTFVVKLFVVCFCVLAVTTISKGNEATSGQPQCKKEKKVGMGLYCKRKLLMVMGGRA